jgi:hypothetical protein
MPCKWDAGFRGATLFTLFAAGRVLKEGKSTPENT